MIHEDILVRRYHLNGSGGARWNDSSVIAASVVAAGVLIPPAQGQVPLVSC